MLFTNVKRKQWLNSLHHLYYQVVCSGLHSNIVKQTLSVTIMHHHERLLASKQKTLVYYYYWDTTLKPRKLQINATTYKNGIENVLELINEIITWSIFQRG